MASFRRQRNDQAFERFHEDVVTQSKEITTASELPRVRKKKKFSDEVISELEHGCATLNDYFIQQYFEVFDTVIAELERRLDREVFLIVVEIEQLLLSAANGRVDSVPVSIRSVHVKDLDLPRLQAQLSMLPDLLRVAQNTSVNVTSIDMITDSLPRAGDLTKLMFDQVVKLILIYFTISVTTATAERSFAVLRIVKTYLHTTMSQDRRNNVMLLHVHKDYTTISTCNALPGHLLRQMTDEDDFFRPVCFSELVD